MDNPYVYVLIENASRILGVFTGDDALDKAKAAVSLDGVEWDDQPAASSLYVESGSAKLPDSFWQAVRFETNITYPFDPKHLFKNE